VIPQYGDTASHVPRNVDPPEAELKVMKELTVISDPLVAKTNDSQQVVRRIMHIKDVRSD
jgi:hypothetical protein